MPRGWLTASQAREKTREVVEKPLSNVSKKYLMDLIERACKAGKSRVIIDPLSAFSLECDKKVEEWLNSLGYTYMILGEKGCQEACVSWELTDNSGKRGCLLC